MFAFSISSGLHVAHTQLWTDLTQFKNINYELMPFARMTCPKQLAILAPETIPLNTFLFNSIILLLGFIPIDIHRLRLSNFQPNQRFDEHSISLLHQSWKHTRILQPIANKTTKITDIVQFKPRLPLIGYLLLPIYKIVFNNRHRKLTARYDILMA